jgi:hypothetical protein
MKRLKTDVLAARIAAQIIAWQTRIAACLNRRTAYWNRASKLTALWLFCLLFGSVCLYLFIKAFY